MITGKGMWIWQIEKTEADAARLVALAKAAGVEHVLIKLSDGEFNFPMPSQDPTGRLEKLTHDAIQAFRDAGIAVWGWGFAYGSGVDMAMQAHRLAGRILQYDLPGVVVNAEDYGSRRWTSSGGAGRARQYMETLTSDLAGAPGRVLIALSSYRYLSAHSAFPFAAFMDYCDIAMPQVYWVARGAGDALRNLQDSHKEYTEAFPRKLYIPTGAAYGEYYGSGSGRYYWSATPEQMTIFLNQAKALGLPAVNFWSWQHARNDSQNLWFSGTQLWDTIASYPYDVSAQPPGDGGEAEAALTIEVQLDDARHFDGVYAGMPNASFTQFRRDERLMKYARTSASRSGVWSAWLPGIAESGQYEIEVWVPGLHASTQRAKYHIHGVVGQPDTITVDLNQQRYYDAWVSLGVYDLDASHPQSGMVNLTNLTGEFDHEIAFAGMRWRRRVPSGGVIVGPGGYLADGFDSPIGTLEERRGSQVWPGKWFDASGFGENTVQSYRDSSGRRVYHTGADLNLNDPTWNRDAGMPIYAVASGEVTYTGSMNVWGNIVIIRHDPLTPGGPYVYSRSAHLARIDVTLGRRVGRGDPIGTIGKPLAAGGTEHLHFDISKTEALLNSPGDWPGLDLPRLKRDYVDPKAFIQQNRPR